MSKQHSLAILLLTVATASLALVACGGGGPPPRPAEVPMDPSTSGSAPSSNESASATASTTNASASDGDPSAGLMGASDPSAGATPPSASDPKSGKGKKGELSKSECQAVSDKGVDLFLAGMGGLDPSMAAQVKAQAASDPNMAGMTSECLKSTTRAQYKCAMSATSKADWQTCLQ